MNSEYYKRYEPIFNAWYIKEMIGEGSFGKVFKIEREDYGATYKAALKAITIPANPSEVKSVMADGMDKASATSYFQQIVKEIINEFVFMAKLKGTSNIVSYEDHCVIEHRDSIGWDILVRMELLTPLIDRLQMGSFSNRDVIQLGIDMCKALELCQKYNIVHRDIKPENIFISDNGDYKLGDFGIARVLEKTVGGLSKKGTYSYMAPEVYRDESYSSNVDIYSLGIVMYRLLNDNRIPFLPPYPKLILYKDREAAIKKRINGEPLPKPCKANSNLSKVVLKACEYNPLDRYSSPAQMGAELKALLDNEPLLATNFFNTKSQDSHNVSLNQTDSNFSLPKETLEYKTPERVKSKETAINNDLKYENVKPPKKPSYPDARHRKSPLIPVLIFLALVAVCLSVWLFLTFRNIPIRDINGVQDVLTLEVGENFMLYPELDPPNASNQEITFASENPSILTVDSSGLLTAISSGEVEINITANGFEKRITVFVNQPHQIVEEWRNEGYEPESPYREYERLYQDGVATRKIRYTGKINPIMEIPTPTPTPDPTPDPDSTTATEPTTTTETTTESTTESTNESATESTTDSTTAITPAATVAIATTARTVRKTTSTTKAQVTTTAATTIQTQPETQPPTAPVTKTEPKRAETITLPNKNRNIRPPDLESDF